MGHNRGSMMCGTTARLPHALSLETMTVPVRGDYQDSQPRLTGLEAPVSLELRTPRQRCFRSVGGKAVEPADATGGVERRLAAPLAHMHRIPRHVPAPGS